MPTAGAFALSPPGDSVRIKGGTDDTLIGNIGDALKVTISGETNVTPVFLRSTAGLVTTPNVQQNLISSAVPAGKTWKVRKVLVVCRRSASFDILVNGVSVGTGRTSAAESNVSVRFEPFILAAATDSLVVSFTQIGVPAVDVEAFLYATET